MSLNTPQQIAEIAVESGVKKAHLSLSSLMILGFLAGAFIALGFLLDIHVSTMIPHEWASLGNLLGAVVFPVGLILVVLAGGELLTGNMMSLPMALFAGRIGLGQLVRNWLLVTLANLIGALFVAYCFGHVVGLTEGAFMAKTVAIANAKVGASFEQAFISGVGCNWLVCLAVWLSYASKDVIGKVVGMWFPVMAFVAIGFQHIVANMFVIPAAIFAGALSWAQFGDNFVPVFLGNAVGGAVFVGLAYHLAFFNAANRPAELSSTSGAQTPE
ncbi:MULTISPECIES: formate/nitrite transporter family protein [Pseudomonas syringae group]|uniref:formate/nitrite transporter family protein n=1 Tax=Pseudomonas syringae group TaxID=136849 RepID=UPI0006D60845|nr:MULTISPECIES: formate/nitrite transporter family protein [Pseudomonas syringae group]KPX31538.1 Formate/nitrite transporter [Pseudomonas coronafaciens pv. garcae]MCF5803365.1 formate/nitrite transporter [Pseudomonas tremae]MCF5807151.1 formate/nitrite transporter [Pseudomonas tremae]RMN31492.1 Formate/nitrite transporter [Pseudomonas coronafaciens pv. zizaniae]RMS96640.1 Formate/nitrite transporter [Pseudomonas coronafaciens pv. oryzae]